MNNGNLPQHKLITTLDNIQTLSKNQHFTDLCAVNKRLTRIISNSSLIINFFLCDTCECTETAKHPGAVGVSKRSKVALLSDKRMHRLNAHIFFLFFFGLINTVCMSQI